MTGDAQVDVPADDFLARKLSIFAPLTAAEYDCLRRLQRRQSRVPSGTELIVQGRDIASAYVLMDGWALRQKFLEDGRRQILSFVLPGDLIGASGSFIRTAEQSVVTSTEAMVAAFKPQRLLTLHRKFPRLGAAISWACAREESMLAERVVSLGRRSAYEAMAHLFLELSQRLQAVGLAHEKAFELPVTQSDLADALGLSAVHVSRTLKKLRQKGLVEIDGAVVRILDEKGLVGAPGYKARYLRHEAAPEETDAVLRGLRAPSSASSDP